eukprot:1179589-Prorocentrum_minimum.AAC.2
MISHTLLAGKAARAKGLAAFAELELVQCEVVGQALLVQLAGLLGGQLRLHQLLLQAPKERTHQSSSQSVSQSVSQIHTGGCGGAARCKRCKASTADQSLSQCASE